MKEYLLVGLGGMLGSMARYFSGSYFLYFYPSARFPWGTFFVNILGCLLIGVFVGITERSTQFNSEIRLIGITGFLGGFTTFSAFGIETLHLFKEGASLVAVMYVLSSVILSVLCAYLGLKLVI